MMRKKCKSLFLIFIVTVFIGCEDEPTLKKPTEIIEGNWQLISEKTIQSNGDTISSISNYKECSTDDIFSFLNSQQLIVLDENIKCSDKQSSFEYKYLIREKTDEDNSYELLVLEGFGHEVLGERFGADLISFSENTLILKRLLGCGSAARPAWCYKLIEFRKK